MPALVWDWTGLYVGGHVGGAWGTTSFSSPFGPSIFGDKLRNPAILGGVQAGFNWQPAGLPWVLGVEADISGVDSDGSVTCFAATPTTVNATCQARPRATGTLTGRIGYAFTPSGRTLVYGKGGLAVAVSKIDMVQNFGGNASFTHSSSENVVAKGWTAGVGFEHALTQAWSLKAEYDYFGFGSRDIANVGSATVSSGGAVSGIIAPGTSSLSQTLHQVKVGLNYKLGADPWDGLSGGSSLSAMAAAPAAVQSGRWKGEVGLRYVAGWGQFHKDIGYFTTSALPSTSSISRLTYDGMQSKGGEVFGRLDSPWNVFVKGYFGAGRTGQGHMNDEDFVIPLGVTTAAYSNTLASSVKGSNSYVVSDIGYDFLRTASSKVGAFVGYFYTKQGMSAYGCTPIANINCIPPVAVAGLPSITESDTWQGVRAGVAAEAMLTDKIKISGEAAYLPYVQFKGLDHHQFGSTGILAEQFEESGKGRGLQLEALISYNVSPEVSIGVGGRYWYLWTSSGQTSCTIGVFGLCGTTPTQPQYFKATVDQAAVFVQASYSFGLN